MDSKVSSVDEVDNNEGGDYYKNLLSKTLSQEVSCSSPSVDAIKPKETITY